MNFKQFYLGCLSHASYYLGSGGEAAIIDPQRDVQQYLDEAEANGQKIKYVIETHSHADFVSGHLELASKTGAQIIYGQRANTQFPTLKVKDGDELSVGAIKLRFLETPGHTPEGITIIAEDLAASGDADRSVRSPLKMFTGDTLPDDTEVYPAHGAGSLCGKSLSKETWSTLGNQRQFNYALQPMSKEEFVKIVAADQPEVPMYFPKSAAKNLGGSPALEELAKPRKMTTGEIAEFDGVVIDVRVNTDFGAGHVPNSINIGLGGQFASWSGTMIPIGTRIAIVAGSLTEVEEAFMRLARVGHDSAVGYILIDEYAGELNQIEQVPVDEVNELAKTGKVMQFVDVRRVAEYNAGHAVRTSNIPLDKLPREFETLDPAVPTYVICQTGYRSSLGASILENAGFKKVYNVTGGTTAWIDAGLEIEAAAAACA
jgi:hydroxyacylglutathione hydrolase